MAHGALVCACADARRRRAAASQKTGPDGKPTQSAHPARFSPDDKFSRVRHTHAVQPSLACAHAAPSSALPGARDVQEALQPAAHAEACGADVRPGRPRWPLHAPRRLLRVYEACAGSGPGCTAEYVMHARVTHLPVATLHAARCLQRLGRLRNVHRHGGEPVAAAGGRLRLAAALRHAAAQALAQAHAGRGRRSRSSQRIRRCHRRCQRPACPRAARPASPPAPRSAFSQASRAGQRAAAAERQQRTVKGRRAASQLQARSPAVACQPRGAPWTSQHARGGCGRLCASRSPAA